ncbi:MAG: class I SAM-dependent methyltransferase [Chloroflexota bacterium]
MNHDDHVNLLRNGVITDEPTTGGTWADIGSGAGAFTLALADLLSPTGHILSIDKNAGSLREQESLMRVRFPDHHVTYRTADYTQQLELPPLDGIVMANSLHFVNAGQQAEVILLLKSYLHPGGRLVLVEYNVDQGNFAVPHPLSYPTWERLATKSGFATTRLLAVRPSRFLTEIYSAVSY